MSTMIGYSDIDSPIHRLTGASKLIALIIWAVASMVTYDTRVLLGMFVISIIVFKISKVEFKQISFVLYFIYSRHMKGLRYMEVELIYLRLQDHIQ